MPLKYEKHNTSGTDSDDAGSKFLHSLIHSIGIRTVYCSTLTAKKFNQYRLVVYKLLLELGALCINLHNNYLLKIILGSFGT